MQTFLPYESFSESLNCLDYKRLGKQRVEADQILGILEGRYNNEIGKRIAWENHPAVLMWKGYEEALKIYRNTAIKIWISKGYKNTMPILECKNTLPELPFWLGFEKLHSSHRSNLLRKDFEFYEKYRWKEDVHQPYFWPIKKDGIHWLVSNLKKEGDFQCAISI